MAFGYQVFDAAGNNILDTTRRTGRILGSVQISGASGFIDVTPVAAGNAPFVVVPKFPRPSQAGQFGEAFMAGSVTFNGSRISWAFSGGGGPAEPVTVYWGAY